MERVTGIGGLFFRARDPDALARWYADHLGIDPVPASYEEWPWWQQRGPTVFSPFPADSDAFGRPEQAWMLNLRVRDLDAMLEQLRARGADVADEVQDMAGVGRFGWVTDPEGHRIELWQPADTQRPTDG